MCVCSNVYICLFSKVSFYRGEVPNDLPEEVAQKRKGHDNQWLATLPLRLRVRVNTYILVLKNIYIVFVLMVLDR